jgi:hypothetical protein
MKNTVRINVVKGSGEAYKDRFTKPAFFTITDSLLMVNFEKCSVNLTPCPDFGTSVRMSIYVGKDVFDSLDWPNDEEMPNTKALDLKNGFRLMVSLSPIAGMTRSEIDALTDEDWDRLCPEPEASEEEKAEIAEMLDRLEQQELDERAVAAEHNEHFVPSRLDL